MRTVPPLRSIFVLTMLLASLVASVAHAADVSASVSSEVVYVDIPFEYTIKIADTNDYDDPVLPAVDGLDVIGVPSQQQSFRSINGRTSRWVDLTYTVVAQRIGTFTIPAFDVIAGGRTYQLQAVTIRALATATGDDVRLEVRADRDLYYVGQRVELALEIWVRAFVDPQLRKELDARDTWGLVSRASQWGIFGSAMRDQVTVRQEAADGAKYYVFELPTRFYPEQSGALTFDDVAIRVDYPQRLVREQDFFGRSSYRPQGVPVVKRLDASDIMIVNAPAEGRPPEFNGAVGRFDFTVEATPTQATVGDPITLTMTVTDRTPGGAQLDLVPAPPIDQQVGLTDRFRLPPDPIGGVIDARRKVFTQTVRATSADVTEIPEIAFAYFDPTRESYFVERSPAIPLMIEAVDSVGMSEVVGTASAEGPGSSELTEVAGGILANYTDPEDLLAVQRVGWGWPMYVLLALPPFAFAAATVVRRRVHRLRHDRAYARRRVAARRAHERLAGASEGDGVAVVSATLSEYVADRLDLPAGALTANEVVERLRVGGVADETIEMVGDLLSECEQRQYAGGVDVDENGLFERARSSIDRLESEALS